LKAGNAVTKKTYQIFKERGLEAKIMPAGLRHIEHMSELAGGEFVFTLQARVQKMVNEAGLPHIELVDEQISEDDLNQLLKIDEFRKSYYEDALAPEDYMAFGVMQKTLSQFMETGWAPLEFYGTNAVSQRWT